MQLQVGGDVRSRLLKMLPCQLRSTLKNSSIKSVVPADGWTDLTILLEYDAVRRSSSCCYLNVLLSKKEKTTIIIAAASDL